MAFEGATWRRVRQLRPDARVAALYSARMLPAAGGGAPSSRRCARPAWPSSGSTRRIVTAEVAKQARLAGLTLGVWTVNEREAIARFIDQGVGVVITDRPDLAKELLGR